MKQTRKIIFLVFIVIAIVGMFLPIATFNDNSSASMAADIEKQQGKVDSAQTQLDRWIAAKEFDRQEKVAAVTRLVMFVTCEDELLELPHYVYLAFHLLFSVYARILSIVSAESMCSIRHASLSAMRRLTPSFTRKDLRSICLFKTWRATLSPFTVRWIGE